MSPKTGPFLGPFVTCMGENKPSGGQTVGPKLGSPNILFSWARFSSVGWLGVGDRSYYPIIVNLDESAVPAYMGGTVRASCTLVLSCGTLYVFLSHRTYTPVHVECVAATLLCRHELRKCSWTLSLNSGLQAVLFRDPQSGTIFRPKRGAAEEEPYRRCLLGGPRF